MKVSEGWQRSLPVRYRRKFVGLLVSPEENEMDRSSTHARKKSRFFISLDKFFITNIVKYLHLIFIIRCVLFVRTSLLTKIECLQTQWCAYRVLKWGRGFRLEYVRTALKGRSTSWRKWAPLGGSKELTVFRIYVRSYRMVAVDSH